MEFQLYKSKSTQVKRETSATIQFQSHGAEPVLGPGFCSLLIILTGLWTFGFQPDWKQQTLETLQSFPSLNLSSLEKV